MHKKYLWIWLLLFSCGQAIADSGLFVGGSFGNTTVSDQIPDNQNVNDIDFRSKDTGYKIYTGLKFGDLAVEVGYVDFGKPNDQGTEVGLTAMDAFGVMDFPVGPLALFGKVGFVRWDYDVDNLAANFKKEGTDPAYGLGARFDLGSIGLRVEYELFDVGEVDDLYLFSAGISYTFF